MLTILAIAPPSAAAQDLAALEGTWRRDPARGSGSAPGVPSNATVRVELRLPEVLIDTAAYRGIVSLGGKPTTLSDGRTASATVGARTLSVTLRRARPGGATNVITEVYTVDADTLTVERVLAVELPDGSLGRIAGGNRATIVYTREPSGR
jgi:hypothetical protein